MAPLLALMLSGQGSPPKSTPLDRVLATQNRARAELKLAPLDWNANLAREAQHWADHLAASATFDHELAGGSGHGENLWQGTRGAYTPEDMANAWIAEKRYFRPGRFPDVSMTGDWKVVGHYSQIVWRETREIGCGIASSKDNDILVCRYESAGNVMGEPPY